MTQDRTYWRAAKEIALIDAARDSGHELCIAIGERLGQNCYADLEEEVSRLNAALEREQDRVAELECELEEERDNASDASEALADLRAKLADEQSINAALQHELEELRDKVTGLYEAMGELEYAAEAKGIVL